MYYPIGWPKQLQVRHNRTPLVALKANRDRVLFAILTEDTISIWYCKPTVEIVCIRRSETSVAECGTNQLIEWKPDSSMVALVTSKGYIQFYKVEMNPPNVSLYQQKEDRMIGSKRETIEISYGDSVPALKLVATNHVLVTNGVNSVVCVREELMIATRSGQLLRLRWDGDVNAEMTIRLSIIPFSVDLQHSRASQLTDSALNISVIEYSPLLGGFSIVLSDGRAAFITASTLKFEPLQVVGVWASEVSAATCTAINHKYTLMAFGCSSGDGIVYHLDELTGALQVSHRLAVSSKDFPDARHVCGSVTALKWTPDGCAIIVVWQNGGFSMWSVYGSLLLCAAGNNTYYDDGPITPLLHISSLEWGSEGYQLWVISHEPSDSPDDDQDAFEQLPAQQPQLLQLQFVKSALTVNPCTMNHTHLFLQGEDKLYLGADDSLTNTTNNISTSGNNSSGTSTAPSGTDNTTNGTSNTHNGVSVDLPTMGSRHWQVVPIPQTYLAYNWPIRYVAVSGPGHCVAVAGKTGIAHYAMYTRKWKLFGNETQERDMVVTGGLTWWKDFVCTACYNLLDQRDEIRFYPRDTKLDNAFCQITRVPSQILLLNTFHNVLIALCADCHVMIFTMERRDQKSSPTIEITKIQEVAIGNFIPHPATVTAIALTSITGIRTETVPGKPASQIHEAESIILNVAGRLLMFQRDRTGPQLKETSKGRPLPFCAPVMVASQVENMWASSHPNPDKPHITEALYLGCGAAGMKIWLPLHPKEDAKGRSFMSKRIMIPFQVNMYPLALIFEGGVLLGANSESLTYCTTSNYEQSWPYMQLERITEVYLHHVLRQLLRRNLGVPALEIARSCTSIPYFSHILELLLHEVLEEEATSKEPIPDPLLPRIVAFIQEFPHFLQTVVHCARKTEYALWQYLFDTVGSPKELFEECLLTGKLETAASYLIILQNLEKPIVSRQHATLLLDSSLEKCHWDLAKDLVRFLKAIDPSEAESPANTPRTRVAGGSTIYPTSYPNPPISPTDSAAFSYPAQRRGRSVSLSKEDHPLAGKDATAVTSGGSGRAVPGSGAKEKPKLAKTDSSLSMKSSVRHSSISGPTDHTTVDQFFIDVILNRHARKLLSSYRVKDLACFSANLEDYQLVQWLRRERLRAARVEDFVSALKQLHADFQWPFPILTLNTLRKMHSMSSLSSLTSSISLLDSDLCSPTSSTAMKLTVPGCNDLGSPCSTGTNDIVLVPQPSIENLSLVTTEQSDTSSVLGDIETPDNNFISNGTSGFSELEQLSHELANKGPPKSEIELRYLLQIMLEAGCLEWALLICLVLRDTMAVIRTVNTASLTDTPIEVVARMREGMSFIELYADTECLGYKPFLATIQHQVVQLKKIVEQDPPHSRMSVVTKRLSSSSTDTVTTAAGDDLPMGKVSPGPQSINNEALDELEEITTIHMEDQIDENEEPAVSKYECAIT